MSLRMTLADELLEVSRPSLCVGIALHHSGAVSHLAETRLLMTVLYYARSLPVTVLMQPSRGELRHMRQL